jgi:hypothetical protein
VPAPTRPPADPELDQLARFGQWIAAAESGRDDERTRGMAAALRAHYVRELDLKPWSVAELSFIKGKLYPSSRLLRSLAGRAGYAVERADSNEETCTAILRRDGRELGRSTFTMEQAKRAGLTRVGTPWQTYPADMLWTKAARRVIDDYAPDVALGFSLGTPAEGEVEAEALARANPPPPPPPANSSGEPQGEPEDADWREVADREGVDTGASFGDPVQ